MRYAFVPSTLIVALSGLALAAGPVLQRDESDSSSLGAATEPQGFVIDYPHARCSEAMTDEERTELGCHDVAAKRRSLGMRAAPAERRGILDTLLGKLNKNNGAAGTAATGTTAAAPAKNGENGKNGKNGKNGGGKKNNNAGTTGAPAATPPTTPAAKPPTTAPATAPISSAPPATPPVNDAAPAAIPAAGVAASPGGPKAQLESTPFQVPSRR